ncbi:hypothetical protein KCU88_g988, partial [Aureobasidium melanogenum]
MEASSFVEQVEDMTDLELAVLLSLIAQHHCMIQVDDDLVDDLASELALNDRVFMSHFHEAEDGFPNLEEMETTTTTTTRPSKDNDNNSETSASVSRSPSVQVVPNPRRIGAELIEQLRAQGEAATVTPELRRYLQDIVVFLRMARGVDGGVTPYATTLFLALAK